MQRAEQSRLARIPRREALRAAGITLALPLLAAMRPSAARSSNAADASAPQRLVAIHVPLGMMPQFFFRARPEAAGQGAAAAVPPVSSPYLELLADHRSQFTVFSGLSHPDVGGNHHAAPCFLTGAPHPGQPTFRNSLSLDQLAAETVGLHTRYPFLSLAVAKGDTYGSAIAISRAGVAIPPAAAIGTLAIWRSTRRRTSLWPTCS